MYLATVDSATSMPSTAGSIINMFGFEVLTKDRALLSRGQNYQPTPFSARVPVAVIYSASLNGASFFVPWAQMEIRALSPYQNYGL